MKKFKLLTILFIGIIFLTGCSKKKTSISADEFFNNADKQGIVVTDVTSLYGLAKKAYQTQPNDGKYKIIFIEGESLNDMQYMFFDEGKNIYEKAGIQDEYETKEVGQLTTKAPTKYIYNGKNWESLEVITDNNYYYLSFIDNTLLYMESDTENRDKMEKLKDTIKY
jgi:hypothetical protein